MVRLGDDGDPAYDIVTPTDNERRDDLLRVRRRRYFSVMVPCLTLVLFGFFVPAPLAVRVAALIVAGILPPVAVIVGSGVRR